MKLLVAGFDAMCPEVVARLGDELPTLARLARDGTFARIHLTDSACTPPIWTSIATGVAYGEHKVRGLTKNGTGELWSAGDVATATLPDVALNKAGLTVGLLNLPVTTHPPRALAGWMTSGDMIYPQAVYPPRLADRLERYPDPYCSYDYDVDTISVDVVREKTGLIFQEFIDRAQVSYRNLSALLDYHEPDVLMAYWHFLDSIQHHMFAIPERVAEAYRLADQMLGSLIERLSPERVLAVSDHGMRLKHEHEAVDTITVDGHRLYVTDWDGHRWVVSGDHSSEALLAASWAESPDQIPTRVEDVLPWALRAAGIEYDSGRLPDSAPALQQVDLMTDAERGSVLARLRELGYG